jgi:uncharacterized membrane protein YcgQ (UPF0703/DUF1980 family)
VTQIEILKITNKEFVSLALNDLDEPTDGWIIVSYAIFIFIYFPLAVAISLIVFIIYMMKQTMIHRDMGKDSIYDRVLARDGIDYACISCSYDLKSRDYPRCGSEKWRVNF